MELRNDIEAIKCVIVGDGAVGKTCILLSYTNDTFPTDYDPTVFDNFSTQLQVENRNITLSLWDTAGQEEYRQLRLLSYPGADVFLICFSVVHPPSFENALVKWYKELQEHAPNAPKVFIGNKIDLREDGTVTAENINKFVSTETARRRITQLGCKYLECSALSQKGLKEAFDEAIRLVLLKRTDKGAEGKCCNLI
eukprot:TRINITY_DN4206_c0_g1_i3.p1 TRINITY_DN4206_c0_g1~~TRINITY_DN4206_c0_g1_i3.p1  ORF type:complete len:196 (+),score=23.75 TRINITY_DN4206_c0_g1_i3:67-654(+)